MFAGAIASYYRKQKSLRPQGRRVSSGICCAARDVLRSLNIHNRHGRFPTNPVSLPLQVAIQHSLANHENAQMAEALRQAKEPVSV